MVMTGYSYSSEPGLISINKFYNQMTAEDASDLDMRRIWINKKNNELS